MEIATVLAIAGLLTALAVIWRQGIVPAWRALKATVHAVEIIQAVPDRLDRLEEVTAQLRPNGGSHLHDDIKETRRILEDHIEECRSSVWNPFRR